MSAPDYPTSVNTVPSGDKARDEAAKLTETARTDLNDLGEEVKQQAAALGEEAKAQIGQVADKAKGMATEQKNMFAGQLEGVSEALEKVAGELETRNDSTAHYARMVADGAQRLTRTVRENDVDDIFAMAQDFGRRQPVAFLGVAALLGFAASRFVTASAARRQTYGEGMTDYSESTTTYGQGSSSTVGSSDYSRSVGGDDAGI